MSSIKYTSYAGHGETMTNIFNYSQAVSIPATARLIYAAGQGGWDSEGNFSDSYEEQVKQAIENVEAALKEAGATLDNVIRVESFHTHDVKDRAITQPLLEILRKLPNKPSWTCVGVASLAAPNMVVEVQVTAAVL